MEDRCEVWECYPDTGEPHTYISNGSYKSCVCMIKYLVRNVKRYRKIDNILVIDVETQRHLSFVIK